MIIPAVNVCMINQVWARIAFVVESPNDAMIMELYGNPLITCTVCQADTIVFLAEASGGLSRPLCRKEGRSFQRRPCGIKGSS